MSPSYLYRDDMELECFKYKEKMKAEEAVCKHPGDYCKYRTSCVIVFLSSEKRIRGNNTELGGDVSRNETGWKK